MAKRKGVLTSGKQNAFSKPNALNQKTFVIFQGGRKLLGPKVFVGKDTTTKLNKGGNLGIAKWTI